MGDLEKAIGQQWNIEAQVGGACVGDFFVFGEEIKQERADILFVEDRGNELVARTFASASTAVRKRTRPIALSGKD